MKRILRIILKLFISIILILFLAGGVIYFIKYRKVQKTYALLGKEAPELNIDGKKFRDLNKNGKLDIYEDYRKRIDDRVEDLLKQMTLEEKAGSMFITLVPMNDKGEPNDLPVITFDKMKFMMSLLFPSVSEMIIKKQINHFNTIEAPSARMMARYNNTLQKIAERTRLGIPITLSTDPRHGSESNPGASIYTAAFSQWPSPLGLAATRDTAMVREFGNIARQEYRSVGFTLALSPMADLATEPRWGRINGTFGEDAELAAKMTKAYVLGFQGDSLNREGVACMSKHFSGGGPQKDGEDPHFPYGKEQVYPGDNFDYHLIPFTKGALPAHTAAIMPYYGIPVGQTSENVGFSFNKAIITGILRDSLQYNGVICTDWNIISGGILGEVRAWGVEDLTPIQRAKKVINAGCDQFGGENVPELIVELVRSGQLTEKRIDESLRRILKVKFQVGLFDNPYVDEDRAEQVAGNEKFREKGRIAQSKAVVLLKNKSILPLEKGVKIYADGFLYPERLEKYGKLVDNITDADVIVTRIKTPFDIRNQYFLENFFHQGRLYYSKEEIARILNFTKQKPTVVVVNLERPAILTEIDEVSSAIVAEFGIDDDVLTEVLFGFAKPSGKLPFELPSSWEAVLKQKSDVPYDSENPLYPYGYGLTY